MPGVIALRRGVALVQAPDQPSVESERGYGERPDEILPVGRQQTEKRSQIPADKKRGRAIGDDLEKRGLFDDVQAVPEERVMLPGSFEGRSSPGSG